MFQYWEVTMGMFIIWKGMFSVSYTAVAPPRRHTATAAAGFPEMDRPLD